MDSPWHCKELDTTEQLSVEFSQKEIAVALVFGHFVRPALCFERQRSLADVLLVVNIWRSHLFFYAWPTSPLSRSSLWRIAFSFRLIMGHSKSESESHSVVSDSLRPHGLYSPWNSPGQNTGVNSHSLLQGIFPTQGSNPDLPHCRQILYQLSHKVSPTILEWVAYLFSRESSWPRNWTRVSCIACGFFTNWAMREAHAIWCIGVCITLEE